MRKQVLLVAVFTILLAGCSLDQQPTDSAMEDTSDNVTSVAEDTTEPIVEDATTTDTVSSADVEEIKNTLGNLDTEKKEKDTLREEKEAEENEKMQKDLDLLGSFNGEPTVSDCNGITHPDIKVACMELTEE